ncbi:MULTISPECIES: hypothetical protein [unclassified Streptomyces]|uniref:hypothetical protein n=1 Tax=unclassified Streptomyces TaxID=2593676 RepID=UPI002E2E24D6|nr:hypothetical protein [Streptomyces sp. NBC_00272]
MSAAGAAIVLTGLITAAGPAAAAGPACTPEIVTLPALTDGPSGTNSVRAFGSDGLLAGASRGLPVYWTADRAVHAVPVPEGFTNGEIKAVNAKGLMVGTLHRPDDHDNAFAFTYQQGAAAVRLIGSGSTPSSLADVNDAGRVVGMEAGVPKEWLGGKVVRELPVPADAHPSTKITSVDGINKRGDIVGTALTYYWEDDVVTSKQFPVVWPAGGGYPPYSLRVWTEDDYTVGTHATGIDDRGQVVGHEDRSYRDWQERKPAVWKKPYDALPNDPGRVAGFEHLTLDAISPTTNVSVGSALTFVEGYANFLHAAYWAGSGAPKALPHPAGTSPDSRSEAFAASDDDRVGGSFYDWGTMTSSAVVWTCASRQAYAPK